MIRALAPSPADPAPFMADLQSYLSPRGEAPSSQAAQDPRATGGGVKAPALFKEEITNER